ncbi:MAG: hypothetical protein R6X08_06595, partial [Desulfosalsimonadaceae bacterium]
MQVKVFEADDMRSALEKVKQALGPDALILSTRSIGKGKFGFSGKSRIEVTAAVDGGGEGADRGPQRGVKDSRPAAAQGPVTSAKPDLRAKEGGFASLLEDRQQKSAKEKGQMA